ncbi:MAG TPA: hypothetical protein VGI45_34650 [Terracidiphilus sp.]|jgi:hypothetical protein
MNDQSHEVSYRAAMDAATAELDGLFEEAKRLRNRMEQIDEVIGALKQVLEPSEFSGSESYGTNQQFDHTLSVAVA